MKEDPKNKFNRNINKSNKDDSLSWTRISKDDLLNRESVEPQTGIPQASLNDSIHIDFSFLDKADADIVAKAKKSARDPEPELEYELVAEEEPFLPPTEVAEPGKILDITEGADVVAEETESVLEQETVSDTEESFITDSAGSLEPEATREFISVDSGDINIFEDEPVIEKNAEVVQPEMESIFDEPENIPDSSAVSSVSGSIFDEQEDIPEKVVDVVDTPEDISEEVVEVAEIPEEVAKVNETLEEGPVILSVAEGITAGTEEMSGVNESVQETTEAIAPKVKKKMVKEKVKKTTKKNIKEKKKKVSAAERKADREARDLAELTADENAFNVKIHKRNVQNSILNAIMLGSVGVFLICAIELGVYSYQSLRYKASMDKIRDAMNGGISVDVSDKLNNMKQDNGDVLVFPDEEAYELMQATKKEEIGDAWAEKYAYLVENNSDCFGYIEIPDTTLSYPVMFTPEKYDFYLWKNFSGEHETRGTPFMDEATKLGKSQNYLVYGHNMTDNSAFGTLKRYLEKSYYQNHKYIYFNTSVSEGVYEVMAVVKTKIFTVEDKCFKYYKYGGVLTEKEFNTYVSEVLKQSVYKTGVTAEWGDQLLTLSTCNHYTEMGRLIIVAKRIL